MSLVVVVVAEVVVVVVVVVDLVVVFLEVVVVVVVFLVVVVDVFVLTGVEVFFVEEMWLLLARVLFAGTVPLNSPSSGCNKAASQHPKPLCKSECPLFHPSK